MTEITLEQYFSETVDHPFLNKAVGAEGMVYKSLSSQNRKVGDRTFELRAATNHADRHNDVLHPDGIDVSNFKLNPLFLWNHGLNGPKCVIGRVLKILQRPTELIATVEYVPLDTNPLPAQLLELELKGLLPAQSIGIFPRKIFRDDQGLRHITKSELIDISKVAMPMNGRAVNVPL